MKSSSIKAILKIDPIKLTSDRQNSAFKLASQAHKNQLRKSGEPYINHCIAVSKIINQEWHITDEDYIIAALLHDVPEDTDITLAKIRQQFGDDVADLVEGVTKLDTGTSLQTLKKVLAKTYLNPGVAIIKLADRLHNMRTLQFMSREKQIIKSSETLDIYARLAESMGMWQVKTELEDLAFKYLEPENYQNTLKKIETDPRQDNVLLSYLQNSLQQLLAENNFYGIVEIQRSGVWAISEKQEKLALKGQGSPDDFSEINDIVGFRIELNTLDDCYRVLNILHLNFGDVVDYDRFDEFIGANKRLNGYQALRTTINFPPGPFEITLVTPAMEKFNKWGVVNLINQKDYESIQNYILKVVFTPTGSVRFLPPLATGVDFACTISPRVLSDAKSIDIDGVQQPLSVVIPNTATVKVNIDTISRRAPLLGLENHCLPSTKKIIKEQRILEKRDKLVLVGKQLMESILINRGLLVLSDLGDTVNPLLYKLGCRGVDDLYFMMGNNSLSSELINQELDEANFTKAKLHLTTIHIKGTDRPKILIDVVQLIGNTNKNIINIDQKNNNSEFDLRILVKNLTPKEEKYIRQQFELDKRFKECLVI